MAAGATEIDRHVSRGKRVKRTYGEGETRGENKVPVLIVLCVFCFIEFQGMGLPSDASIT